MRRPSLRRSCVTLAMLLLGAAACFIGTSSRFAALSLGDEPAGTPATDSHAADREAIAQCMRSFLADVERRDAKAVAGHWTTDGEYIGDDGTHLRGRKAIEDAYREHLVKSPKKKVQFETESLRFPSRDTAVEEGYFKVQPEGGESTSSRYQVIHVRENGGWLMAVVQEWPNEGASLRDLEWLIGKWGAKHGDTEVVTSYEWLDNKAFMRMHFQIKGKDRNMTGFQIIARDPGTGQLRSWTFERDGGFGEASWTSDGRKWTQEASGTLADGSALSATNIMTKTNDNAFIWQSVNRSLDGEDMPDLPPIKVSRLDAK